MCFILEEIPKFQKLSLGPLNVNAWFYFCFVHCQVLMGKLKKLFYGILSVLRPLMDLKFVGSPSKLYPQNSFVTFSEGMERWSVTEIPPPLPLE